MRYQAWLWAPVAVGGPFCVPDSWESNHWVRNSAETSISCELQGLCAFSLQDRDVREGADMLMVKPGMPYLDLVRDAKERVRPG